MWPRSQKVGELAVDGGHRPFYDIAKKSFETRKWIDNQSREFWSETSETGIVAQIYIGEKGSLLRCNGTTNWALEAEQAYKRH